MDRLEDVIAWPTESHTGQVAITGTDGHSIDYPELKGRVEVLQTRLQRLGSGTGQTVGICLPKSENSLVSVLATLASGAAYVPIDFEAPASRSSSILQDARVTLVIVEERDAAQLETELTCPVEREPCELPEVVLLRCLWPSAMPPEYAEDLAMILYTSGSTGVPKGVQITHANALSFVQWCLRTFSVQSTDVIASIAPFHFDLSVFDIFVSLHQGAALLLLDQKTCQNPLLVAQQFERQHVSTCYATPTFLKHLLRFGRLQRCDHSSLKRVLFAGEVFSIQALRELRRIWPQARFYNLYGPTETNVVTWFTVPGHSDDNREDPYPIGQPCDHVNCLVLTEKGAVELADGVEGELLVSGPPVTPGYLGKDPDKAATFVSLDESSRYYHTGDIVRYDRAEGGLVFLRRKDRMVKRRGYRIAPEEVERVVGLHEAVLQAAVTSPLQGDEQLLIAHISVCPGCDIPTNAELKRHCLLHLPSYFLPDEFAVLESFPMTSSGKIDYRNLTGIQAGD